LYNNIQVSNSCSTQ